MVEVREVVKTPVGGGGCEWSCGMRTRGRGADSWCRARGDERVALMADARL